MRKKLPMSALIFGPAGGCSVLGVSAGGSPRRVARIRAGTGGARGVRRGHFRRRCRWNAGRAHAAPGARQRRLNAFGNAETCRADLCVMCSRGIAELVQGQIAGSLTVGGGGERAGDCRGGVCAGGDDAGRRLPRCPGRWKKWHFWALVLRRWMRL